jgi:hypothetical protein
VQHDLYRRKAASNTIGRTRSNRDSGSRSHNRADPPARANRSDVQLAYAGRFLPVRPVRHGKCVRLADGRVLPFAAGVRPLLQNKFTERQISRISDFEIEVVVQDQNNLVTESLDHGDFIRHQNVICDSVISFFN